MVGWVGWCQVSACIKELNCSCWQHSYTVLPLYVLKTPSCFTLVYTQPLWKCTFLSQRVCCAWQRWQLSVVCWKGRKVLQMRDLNPSPLSVQWATLSSYRGTWRVPLSLSIKTIKTIASEYIYELTMTPVGYQVSIRFFTCTDEGTYRIRSETFNLSAKADKCGMFYYTAKVDKVKKAAFVSLLDGVIRISMLYIQPENSQMWSLIAVWNDTMSRTLSPAH